MQKGEWLPFSLLSSFCILHFHSWGQAPSPLGTGQGEGELGSRRFHGASSPEHDTLQTWFRFLAALDIPVRRWAFGLTNTQRRTRMSDAARI